VRRGLRSDLPLQLAKLFFNLIIKQRAASAQQQSLCERFCNYIPLIQAILFDSTCI
jgi:hypothetical protein